MSHDKAPVKIDCELFTLASLLKLASFNYRRGGLKHRRSMISRGLKLLKDKIIPWMKEKGAGKEFVF